MKNKTIVLASNNPGKLKEFRQLFSDYGLKVVPQNELDIPDTPEPYCTFVENALTKARHASRMSGLPAIADDSGLCVDALNGQPGVYSARYAGEPRSDEGNNALLIRTMAGQECRTAHYYCCLVFVRSADDPRPVIVDGDLQGIIRDTPAGSNGFGYDPYFYIPELGKTAAEMTLEEKNRYSHRARALGRMIDALKSSGLIPADLNG